MLTDAQGAVIRVQDYLPFGEEMTGAAADQPQFTGKWRDEETGRDDFGARHYAGPFGRFLSTDAGAPNPSEPQTWNRYAYVTNNPLRFDDPDGRLKRDKTGQVIFKKESEKYVRHGGAPFVNFHVEVGYVIADNGDRIEAYRAHDTKDVRMKCDCHGLTFADGRLWINDGVVNRLLQGDQYKKTDKPRVGDVAIYRDKWGKVVHSMTVTAVDKEGNVTEVSGLGGLELKAHSNRPEPGPGGGWPDPSATIEYWHKVMDARSLKERMKAAEQIKKYEK